MTDHGVDTAIIVDKKNGCADGMKDCFDTIGEANADEGGDEALATATEALGTLKVSTEATETRIEKNITEKNKDKTNDILSHSSPLPLLSPPPPPPPTATPLSPSAPVDIIRSRFSSWKNKADDVLRNSEMLRVAKGIVVEGSRESLGEFGSLVKRSGASKPKDAYNKHGGNGESGTKSSPRSSINRSGAELRTPRRIPLSGRKTLSPAVGIYTKKKASSASSPRKRNSPTKTAKLRAAMFGNGSDVDTESYPRLPHKKQNNNKDDQENNSLSNETTTTWRGELKETLTETTKLLEEKSEAKAKELEVHLNNILNDTLKEFQSTLLREVATMILTQLEKQMEKMNVSIEKLSPINPMLDTTNNIVLQRIIHQR